jgi:molecular chaperone Hsp33
MPHTTHLPGKDLLFRFLFEQCDIRGELVHLDDSWQAVLQRQSYPAPVRDLLGQTMAAAALLSATLKNDAALIVQIQGDGAVPLLVVQIDNQTHLRGMAEWHGDIIAGPLADLCGRGHLTITIDPADGNERYQSIIELGPDSLSRALDNYFQQSEQLNTRLWLSADDRCAAGLLLQELPADMSRDHLSVNQDDDTWNRILHLSDTLTATELRDLPVREILKRLYHEETVRIFEPNSLFFRCSCSRERIANTLRSLGHAETQSIIEDEGLIAVECSFCKKSYQFDSVDCQALFTDTPPADITHTRH